MPQLPGVLADALDRADATLVGGSYHTVSVPTERVRAWLRFRRLAFVDPLQAESPTVTELERTAEVVIARSRGSTAAIAGIAGLGGVTTIPSELLATAITTVRLAQRLCVVFGFDPETDRGQMALARTLAAAYEIDLPDTGAMGLRVSDLPGLLRPETEPTAVGGKLAKAMVTSSAWWVAGKVTRLVPVLFASSHAWSSAARIEETGRRMVSVLRRLAEVAPGTGDNIEEAHEVGR